MRSTVCVSKPLTGTVHDKCANISGLMLSDKDAHLGINRTNTFLHVHFVVASWNNVWCTACHTLSSAELMLSDYFCCVRSHQFHFKLNIFTFFFLICSITYFIQISSMTFINALLIFHSEARRGDVQKAEKHWWRESKGTREQDSPALPEHHIHIVCLLHPPAKHIIDVELLEDNGNVSIERKYADSVKNSSVFQWREEIRLDIANSEGVTSSCL